MEVTRWGAGPSPSSTQQALCQLPCGPRNRPSSCPRVQVPSESTKTSASQSSGGRRRWRFEANLKGRARSALSKEARKRRRTNVGRSSAPVVSRKVKPSIKKQDRHGVWWCTPVIPALGRLRQEDHPSQDCLIPSPPERDGQDPAEDEAPRSWMVTPICYPVFLCLGHRGPLSLLDEDELLSTENTSLSGGRGGKRDYSSTSLNKWRQETAQFQKHLSSTHSIQVLTKLPRLALNCQSSCLSLPSHWDNSSVV
ncbi:uncharacterized protein LOC117283261 [Fukomys damarensis]|uniref:uncharacterized protein LOC117283261 n=1 Tax=Fukomys damarensis TaxID=885580 RepID=UPI00145569D6|nr:uncharacterized protein LOC117283261 [Fukomys damarensis]